ncbi:protein TolA [Bradyrhizobium sp. STM 3562]|uniref:protein TolA n=1 Tax=Bradyrhizobium sp. STM 3562 TaxID=578924 RepID=UPI00389027B8
MKIKVDKSLAASITLHVLVLGWGLVSFSARSYEVPQDSLVVDVISADQLAKVTAGTRNGEKDKPKPLVEKVAEAKPIDEAVGKVTEKQEIITSSAPQPPPKPVEKPVEKKPEPPKPVENKPKDEPKQVEKKPDPPKVDPIAEALKSDDSKKPKPKQEAKAAPPKPPKPKQERVFDESKIAALLDKRDPTHQAITGAALNASASLGLHSGNAESNVATWKGAFVAAVRRCFNFPYNGQDADRFEADIDIQMRPDGTLASEPTIVAVRGPSTSIGNAMAESAKRAIVQCQAYAFLPKEQYNTWKYIPMTFGLKDMM